MDSSKEVKVQGKSKNTLKNLALLKGKKGYV